jgi:hypothetical protein
MLAERCLISEGMAARECLPWPMAYWLRALSLNDCHDAVRWDRIIASL